MNYFNALGRALEKAGVHEPALVIDTARMDSNLRILRERLPRGMNIRLADKSLPVRDLLRHAHDALNTRDFMSFHLPITRRVLADFPDANVLMGKPIPIGSIARCLDDTKDANRITWLADSMETLAQLNHLNRNLCVALEIDVGMGRGGFEDPSQAWTTVQEMQNLNVVGLMGYEAHVNALPTFLGRGTKAMKTVQDAIKNFSHGHELEFINSGGSSTALMMPTGIVDDITLGSLIVKPSDFDQDINVDIQPALFISAPVLKTHPHKLPGHPRLTKILHRLGIIGRNISFIYGGKWMATPVHPAGLKLSPFFGQSSNQQGLVLANRATQPDRITFRPTQSESVLQQFPEIHLFDGETITGTWTPYR